MSGSAGPSAPDTATATPAPRGALEVTCRHPVLHASIYENGVRSLQGPDAVRAKLTTGGGGGTRTPKGLRPPHFECGALPIRTTPPEPSETIIYGYSRRISTPRRRKRASPAGQIVRPGSGPSVGSSI